MQPRVETVTARLVVVVTKENNRKERLQIEESNRTKRYRLSKLKPKVQKSKPNHHNKKPIKLNIRFYSAASDVARTPNVNVKGSGHVDVSASTCYDADYRAAFK